MVVKGEDSYQKVGDLIPHASNYVDPNHRAYFHKGLKLPNLFRACQHASIIFKVQLLITQSILCGHTAVPAAHCVTVHILCIIYII